ncbi:SCO family protein [Erythrobacter sp. MTPC3]|uniref:SCO family protein n=1 Tax=Erythrobacter sp. MTPC3 TaxID=3056564 RepID=UPI0036F3D77F
MNRIAKPSRRNRFVTAIACAALFAGSACSEPEVTDGPVGPSADGVDLRGSSLGGEFELTSHTGETVKWSDFDGQYRMIYFGFTSCPAICPTDVQRATRGLMAFEEAHPELAGKVQPIFVSIDPDRDTPDALNQFVSAFHPRLIGLTGSQEEVDAVIAKFGGSAEKLPAQENGWYDMQHTNFTYLFAPDGSPLGIIPTDKRVKGVTAELERWIR